jgi:hypothetical protein
MASYNETDSIALTLLGISWAYWSSVSNILSRFSIKGKDMYSIPYFVGVQNPIKSTELL